MAAPLLGRREAGVGAGLGSRCGVAAGLLAKADLLLQELGGGVERLARARWRDHRVAFLHLSDHVPPKGEVVPTPVDAAKLGDILPTLCRILLAGVNLVPHD